ncbi:MAG: CPBP family intramembrane metalloprotease [Olsenella sp.]|nr:CPBP family intramembrane metalloprotease [Olsenella sp.]
MDGRTSRGRVALFLVLAFAIDWACWVWAGSQTGWSVAEGSGPWPAVLPLSMFVPLVAALVVRAVPGADVLRGWRPRVRGNVRWYVVALLTPSVLTLLGALVYLALVPGAFDPTAKSYAQLARAQLGPDVSQVPALMAAQFASAALLAPFFNMIFAIGEEAGWRGFLYPALRDWLSRPVAMLATGAIWGLWHAPLIAMGYNYGTSYPGFPVVGILAMVLFCTGFGTLLCLLRDVTNSVWPCALAHGALNAVAGLPVWLSTSGIGILGPAPLGLLACIPTLLLCVWILVGARRSAPSGME